jgi:hypothetical protein
MLPGANETQYAHNTPLQLLSELGYTALIAGAILFLLAVRAARRGEYRNNFSFPSDGGPRLARAQPDRHRRLLSKCWGDRGGTTCRVTKETDGGSTTTLRGLAQPPLSAWVWPWLAFSILAMVSAELQQRAQIEYDQNNLPTAALTLEQAKALMPWNSSLFHDSGDINLALYHRRHNIRDLEVATASFKRAIQLSPDKVGSARGDSAFVSPLPARSKML